MRHRLIFLIAALLPIPVLAACADEGKRVEPGARSVVAHYVSGGLGDVPPDWAVWNDAPEMIVPMLAQDLTDPKLAGSTLPEIRVRALTDNTNVAFRIEWEDSTQSTVDSGKQFSDAVAVQLPPAPGGTIPDPTMGQADKPVHIQLWKASYEGGGSLDDWSLQQTFPNATVDHYPFEAAPEGESEKLTRQYTIALAAGNPLIRERKSSVDDLIANGFGTLSHLPTQVSKGWSKWQNDRWTVVISRPLSEPGWPGGEGLRSGQNTFVAFAVWDGALDQGGSRKMRSVWIPLELGGTQ
jgi:hypothetical protein